MNIRDREGFTRRELIVVVVSLALVALVSYPGIHASVEQAVSTSMKSNGRSIWLGVVTANEERKPFGLPAVWPKDIGFDSSRSSTEYFRMLLSDYPTGMTNEPNGPIAEDLKPSRFGGAGVPHAETMSGFTSKNNAWYVICVSTQTEVLIGGDVPFLITRNVEIGRHVNASSSVTFTKKSPLWIRRCVYLTCGGGCFDRRKKYLGAPGDPDYVLNGMGTNTSYDVMYP